MNENFSILVVNTIGETTILFCSFFFIFKFSCQLLLNHNKNQMMNQAVQAQHEGRSKDTTTTTL
jgi:hypothetical protein